MPEMRKDILRNQWVIFSPERAKRPTDYIIKSSGTKDELNPFLEGRESETPPEIYAIRKPGTRKNTPGWKVRVVPNKFPVLKIEGEINASGEGIYDRMNGIGAHEVVIESPDPLSDLATMSEEQGVLVFKVIRQRILDLVKDRRFKYILVARNHGVQAGSSLSHPHTQIVALPTLPDEMKHELNATAEYFEWKNRCLYCDMLLQETKDNRRIILQNEDFVVFSPYASRVPYETWVMPRFHHHDFSAIEDRKLDSLVNIIRQVLMKLKAGLDDPPYNMVLHTSPNVESFEPRPKRWETLQYDMHWHIEILPRLSNSTGIDSGTGLYVNPVLPEQAAEYIRDIDTH